MIEKFHTYKGYPLVRKGDEIYFGYMSDPYVIYIQVIGKKEEAGQDVTSKVRIVQMDTNEPNPMKAFVKNAERECGLYEALDVASVWLEKALKN